MNVWLDEKYFTYLQENALGTNRGYSGLCRELHAIPFFWTMWGDENRAGDALDFRKSDFLAYEPNLAELDQIWLGQWAMAAPSVLEVLVGIARRWSFFFEGSPDYYILHHLFKNMGYDRFTGVNVGPKAREIIQKDTETWLTRQFEPNGHGSPFPVYHAFDILDMRELDMWSQMNAYSAEHFQ